MLEERSKPDDLEATAKDYLGQPSPVAFKNQPALPGGGPGIGVGAGPATTAEGTSAADVRQRAMFDEFIKSLGLGTPEVGGVEGGGAGQGAEGALGEPGSPGVSGFDSTTAGIGLNAALTAMGIPGLVGLVSGLATGVPAASGIPGLGAAKGATSVLGAIANALGLTSSNMTAQTSEGPVSIAPTYSGFFAALANAIMGQPNFAGIDPSTGQVTTAPPSPDPQITMGLFGNTLGHPAFGHQGFNAPSQSPAPRGSDVDATPTGPPAGPPATSDQEGLDAANANSSGQTGTPGVTGDPASGNDGTTGVW